MRVLGIETTCDETAAAVVSLCANGRGEILSLFAFKLLHYGWSLALPLWLLDLPTWQILLGFAVMHLTAGLVLSVVFQLAHVVEEVPVIAADPSGAIEAEWWAHQLRTTSNFAMGNRVVSWFVGGLNHQIEHHLFPRICHIHYPRISKLVEETCREFGVRYHAHKSFFAGVASHFRWLRQMGQGGQPTTA